MFREVYRSVFLEREVGFFEFRKGIVLKKEMRYLV